MYNKWQKYKSKITAALWQFSLGCTFLHQPNWAWLHQVSWIGQCQTGHGELKKMWNTQHSRSCTSFPLLVVRGSVKCSENQNKSIRWTVSHPTLLLALCRQLGRFLTSGQAEAWPWAIPSFPSAGIPGCGQGGRRVNAATSAATGRLACTPTLPLHQKAGITAPEQL